MAPPGTSSSAAASERLACVTVDLHDDDRPLDVEMAANVLAERGVRATFFIPGALLSNANPLTPVLRALPRLGHEVGSHSLRHDHAEIEALRHATTRAGVAFLADAHACFKDFYGAPTTLFRSPVWCQLGEPALDELLRLGYEIDSSATPQRLQILTSRPFARGWHWSPRSPHFIRGGLLEIPTTSALVPAGSTTFRVFRRRLSRWFVRMLIAEAALFPSRILVLQFDSKDFNPEAVRYVPRPLRFDDFVLRSKEGLKFYRWLLNRNAPDIAGTTSMLLDLLPRTITLTDARAAWLDAHPRVST